MKEEITKTDTLASPKPKRKTHTSSKVKNRYNDKNYSKIPCFVSIEDAERYRQKCKAKGIPLVQIPREAIYKFLEEE